MVDPPRLEAPEFTKGEVDHGKLLLELLVQLLLQVRRLHVLDDASLHTKTRGSRTVDKIRGATSFLPGRGKLYASSWR